MRTHHKYISVTQCTPYNAVRLKAKEGSTATHEKIMAFTEQVWNSAEVTPEGVKKLFNTLEELQKECDAQIKNGKPMPVSQKLLKWIGVKLNLCVIANQLKGELTKAPRAEEMIFVPISEDVIPPEIRHLFASKDPKIAVKNNPDIPKEQLIMIIHFLLDAEDCFSPSILTDIGKKLVQVQPCQSMQTAGKASLNFDTLSFEHYLNLMLSALVTGAGDQHEENLVVVMQDGQPTLSSIDHKNTWAAGPDQVQIAQNIMGKPIDLMPFKTCLLGKNKHKHTPLTQDQKTKILDKLADLQYFFETFSSEDAIAVSAKTQITHVIQKIEEVFTQIEAPTIVDLVDAIYPSSKQLRNLIERYLYKPDSEDIVLNNYFKLMNLSLSEIATYLEDYHAPHSEIILAIVSVVVGTSPHQTPDQHPEPLSDKIRRQDPTLSANIAKYQRLIDTIRRTQPSAQGGSTHSSRAQSPELVFGDEYDSETDESTGRSSSASSDGSSDSQQSSRSVSPAGSDYSKSFSPLSTKLVSPQRVTLVRTPSSGSDATNYAVHP